MEIKFCPNNYQPSGLLSRRSWSDPELKAMLRKLFHESPREVMVEAVIDRDGVTAKFESKSELRGS